jgi:hypothetical protein
LNTSTLVPEKQNTKIKMENKRKNKKKMKKKIKTRNKKDMLWVLPMSAKFNVFNQTVAL